MTEPTPRLKRLCDVCGQLDTDPRHVQWVAADFPGAVPDKAFFDALPDGVPASAIAEQLEPTTVVRHIDCCAERGCQVCQATQATHDGLKGDKLLKHLESGVVDNLFQPADAGDAPQED